MSHMLVQNYLLRVKVVLAVAPLCVLEEPQFLRQLVCCDCNHSKSIHSLRVFCFVTSRLKLVPIWWKEHIEEK